MRKRCKWGGYALRYPGSVIATQESAPARGQDSTDERIEAVLARLRSNGGRITTARRLLLQILFQRGPHRTAEDIAREVHAVAPDVNLSTIYRNLDELERLGVIVHAHLGHGAAIYHLQSDAHGHLVCESCGAMAEAPAELFQAFAAAAHEKLGFVIDYRHFAVLGRCQQCHQADYTPTGATD